MKKAIFAVIVFAVVLTAVTGYASDYKGEEDRGSVFQVLGDLITGNYKVDGKPIKEKGWFQVSADETKKLKLAPEEDAMKADKTAKP